MPKTTPNTRIGKRAKSPPPDIDAKQPRRDPNAVWCRLETPLIARRPFKAPERLPEPQQLHLFYHMQTQGMALDQSWQEACAVPPWEQSECLFNWQAYDKMLRGFAEMPVPGRARTFTKQRYAHEEMYSKAVQADDFSSITPQIVVNVCYLYCRYTLDMIRAQPLWRKPDTLEEAWQDTCRRSIYIIRKTMELISGGNPTLCFVAYHTPYVQYFVLELLKADFWWDDYNWQAVPDPRAVMGPQREGQAGLNQFGGSKAVIGAADATGISGLAYVAFPTIHRHPTAIPYAQTYTLSLPPVPSSFLSAVLPSPITLPSPIESSGQSVESGNELGHREQYATSSTSTNTVTSEDTPMLPRRTEGADLADHEQQPRSRTASGSSATWTDSSDSLDGAEGAVAAADLTTAARRSSLPVFSSRGILQMRGAASDTEQDIHGSAEGIDQGKVIAGRLSRIHITDYPNASGSIDHSADRTIDPLSSALAIASPYTAPATTAYQSPLPKKASASELERSKSRAGAKPRSSSLSL